ncbi:regulatory LuxR family protein [Mariniflexile fucanivorans]|uniref:Regulatory LuxR family protein n=1 Tax=Mariniflexile fucanivorans TaxID=264023 RepID=A0A4R1RL75_9FLAO|nr:LuxR C-terminal-related transcriptional regulator [Mariniflexile fucanivorans]TCL66789.1 regulatory LuxR family protein [Mariniflexile fucanivorans]
MNLNLKYIKTLVFLWCLSAFSQNGHEEGYLKYIDLAVNKVDDSPKIADLYLDSIPKPLKESIPGHIACYYDIRALINDRNNETSKRYQNYVLALKYAKSEKNYDIAGKASLEIFYNTYLVKKDTTAYKYLESAKKYYTLSDNKNGLLEVEQMPAYVEFYNGNYRKSNDLILQHLEAYKAVEDDAYYYMYALFMLTSNYIGLEDINKGHKYFNKLKSLNKNPSISKPLYNSHVVTIYGRLSSYYFKNKNIDSTAYYISSSGKLRHAMNDYDERNYYKLNIDYHDYLKDYNKKNSFIDSLKLFEEETLTNIMDASFQIGDSLLNSESELETVQKKRNNYIFWTIAILSALLLILLFFVIKVKKSKKIITEFEKSNDEFTYFKNNHEKLKVKVNGIESYIVEIKKELKSISNIKNTQKQQEQIIALYKNIHHNASTLLSKSENHLEIINEFNVDFFNQLSLKHPELNASETIVCYYLYKGFKSKEIAAFLNTSERAIEGKRYRISNKLNITEKGYNLVEYLTNSLLVLKQ